MTIPLSVKYVLRLLKSSALYSSEKRTANALSYLKEVLSNLKYLPMFEATPSAIMIILVATVLIAPSFDLISKTDSSSFVSICAQETMGHIKEKFSFSSAADTNTPLMSS